MIRLATCQLCCMTKGLRPSRVRAFSLSKVQWRKVAAVEKIVQDVESIPRIPTTPSPPSSADLPLSSIDVEIPSILTPPTAEEDAKIENYLPDGKTLIHRQTLPTTTGISDAPIKILNAVDKKLLVEAAAETHRLEYSKLPAYYLSLSKSRLTGLVVVTAMAGYAMAPATFTLLPFASLVLGTTLTSAAANTINQIMEVEFDAQMDRTKNRVLVQRNLSVTHATAFAAVTGLGGVAILALGANPLTAVLGAFNLGLYTCIYTPLKRRTIANTWVGSIVGGIPPLMGWAACTGELSHGALLLGGILYAWQFPHFNALSWNIRKDYDKAGYKMMAISHPDLCKTTSLRYSFGIIAMSSLAPVCDVTSWTFVADSLPLNGYLAYLAYRFYKDGDSASSRKLFRFTLIHLPVLIMLMMISKKNYKEVAPCPLTVVPVLTQIEPPPTPLLS